MLGRIPAQIDGTFYDLFIAPWLNLFSVTTGIFLTLLFGWLAAIYLLGEARDDKSFQTFAKTSRTFFVLLIISGLSVFLVSEMYDLNFFSRFLHSSVAIGCVVVATAMIPLLWVGIRHRNNLRTRFLAGVQTACILTGWFAIQFPVMIYLSDGSQLTIQNSQAPEKTMVLLVYALIAGILLIFPAFYFLFKVFKFGDKESENINKH